MKIHVIVMSIILLVACNVTSAWEGITVNWSVSVNGFGTNIVSGNQLIGFADFSNTLLSVDVKTQEISWQENLNNSQHISYRQLTSDGKSIFAYIPGQGLHTYSLSGELLSKIPAPPSLPSDSAGIYGAGPILYQQNLYLPINNVLFAYDISNPKQPKLLWEREFVESSLWALAVDDKGGIYVGVTQQSPTTLQSLNPQNGQTLWTADTTPPTIEGGVPAPTALTVVGEKVIAAVESSFTIQAFDKTTGERLYVSEDLSALCPDGQGTITSFEIADGNLYVSPREGTCIYGINAETGKVLWTHSSQIDPNTNFTYGGTPKYVNGVVYASNSALWALDAKTGKVLAISSNRDDDALFTNVQYANGEILVWGKNLTAYKPIR